MSLLYLALAILFEIIGTIALKQSAATTVQSYITITIASYIISFYCLWLSLKTLPLSLAYATWCGVGIALATIAGVFIFKEKVDTTGYIGLSFIIIGIVLLNGLSSLNSNG